MVEGNRIGGGYFMHVQPEAIFDKVFNSTNPWEDQPNLNGSDFTGSMFGDGLNSANSYHKRQVQDVELEVECSLLEFYMGCTKHLSYEIDEVQHDGKTLAKKSCTRMIEIKPGFS